MKSQPIDRVGGGVGTWTHVEVVGVTELGAGMGKATVVPLHAANRGVVGEGQKDEGLGRGGGAAVAEQQECCQGESQAVTVKVAEHFVTLLWSED